MRSAPRPHTAVGNGASSEVLATEPLSQLPGGGGRQRREAAYGLSAPHFCPRAPCGPHLVPVDPEQASPCSLASASTGPAWLPGPRGQCAARQPWARPGEAARARKGCPPPPGVGVGRQLEPVVPAQAPSASLEWPSAGGEAFPPAPLPHESPNHTQAEPRQLPPPTPPHIPRQNPYSRVGGTAQTPHPRGGREGQSCPPGRPAATVAWGGAVLCSQDAHPLWSWQAALHPGGRKRARQRQPRFLPPARPPRAQAEQSAFICLLLAASLLTSARHCLLANRTQTA